MLLSATAALAAAVAAWAVVTLPPAALRPSQPAAPPELVSGAYHIHSTRSDGSGTVDDIAAAAARAGLRFIIITDHGDATRPPDPPEYRHGVLCIDALEISSFGGHIVALNLRGASAFPLAGEAREVVDDIHRLGGWAVAAHPDSPRPALRWRAGGVAFDGIEWLNADSEWRAHSAGKLAAAAARAWLRPAETIADLFRWPERTLARWDAALRARPTFSLAALDAHARLGADSDGRAWSPALSFPSYEAMFRTVVQTVRLERPPTGNAQIDADAVLTAIGAGRSYSVVRAFIDSPHALEFFASGGNRRVEMGGTLAGAGPVTLRAAVSPGTGAQLVLLSDSSREVATGRDVVEYQTSTPGAYRVEARLGSARPVPWIVSNAIRIGGEVSVGRPPPVPDGRPTSGPSAIAVPPDAWVIESDRSSTGQVRIDDAELRLSYRLGPGAPAGQYVALASSAAGDTALDRLEFVASSLRPMRLSVQVRLPAGADGQRWRRSIYVDEVPRAVSVRLADLEPVDRTSPLRPIVDRVQSVLLVVDTLNARPGTAGELLLRDVRFVPGAGGEAGRRRP